MSPAINGYNLKHSSFVFSLKCLREFDDIIKSMQILLFAKEVAHTIYNFKSQMSLIGNRYFHAYHFYLSCQETKICNSVWSVLGCLENFF